MREGKPNQLMKRSRSVRSTPATWRKPAAIVGARGRIGIAAQVVRWTTTRRRSRRSINVAGRSCPSSSTAPGYAIEPQEDLIAAAVRSLS
jgi:hypothetical protein